VYRQQWISKGEMNCSHGSKRGRLAYFFVPGGQNGNPGFYIGRPNVFVQWPKNVVSSQDK